METTRFDRIAQAFAARRLSRRQAMTTGAGAIAGAATLPLAALANEATPAASPAASPVANDTSTEPTTFLFVQSFQSGSLAANTSGDLHTLTLEHGLGQTIYFGDRPSRDVGVTPTADFIKGFNFGANDPPNAALIVDIGDETDLAVIELTAPTYDAATHTATYQVRALDSWNDGPAFGLQATAIADLAPTFEGAHLLIDDCSDDSVACVDNSSGDTNYFDTLIGFCYNYAQCMPCTPYGHDQPSACATWDYWQTQCNQTSYVCSSGNCNPTWGQGISDWLGCS